MAIAFVNAGYANPGPGTSAQTQAQAVTTGNLLVVLVGWSASGVSVTSVVDTAGNTYVPLSQQASSTFAFGQLFYAYNVTGNAANRVTVTLSASSIVRVYCAQYSGADTTSGVYDEEANTGVSGTAATAANVTIPDNGVLVAGAFFRDDRTPTWDAAFASRGDISNITIADQIVTTGLTAAAQLSWTTSAYVVLCSAVFKVAGGGPVAPNPPTGVTMSSITRTSATVSWTDASSDEDGFDVEVAASPYSSWTTVTATAANVTTASITGLSEGTTYKVRVRSFDSDADSTWAESSAFTTLTRKIKAVLHSSAVGDTGIAGVVFEAPAGADLTGARLGEFTGMTGVSDGSDAAVKIPIASVAGAAALAPGDTPVVYLQSATKNSPLISATVVDE